MKKSALFSLIISFVLFGCNYQSEQKQDTEGEVITETIQRPNTLTGQELADGWILIFNGLTSDGWRSHNGESFPENGWEVTDGSLHVLGSGRGEAGGGGDILFAKKFT